VLDFGRTTFGASCTGAAKVCLAKAVEHARGSEGIALGALLLGADDQVSKLVGVNHEFA
jgi:alkylation response protein AidB-like acyl-CoA dehydrogenase